MAQVSVANYFNNRKRAAADETKINIAKKVLILDEGPPKPPSLVQLGPKSDSLNNNDTKLTVLVKTPSKLSTPSPSVMAKRKILGAKTKKIKGVTKLGNIEQLLNNMNKVLEASPTNKPQTPLRNDTKDDMNAQQVTPNEPLVVRQPSTPTKKLNAMDKVSPMGVELNLKDLKQKMSRSSRMAELKASLSRFKKSEKDLKVVEERTEQIKQGRVLKNFQAIELEVNLSPQKPSTPDKPYLSPKKDTGGARKNLLTLLSPSKSAVQDTPVKESLTLPYKYRCLAEIFRAVDTVCQILHNRHETITFRKLKPAVEAMLKRNLTEKHLGQIMSLYPDSFELRQEKMRDFGSGTRQEQWQLVLALGPDQSTITPEVLLQRRRKFFKILIEKLKDYHGEFLATLDPPMVIPRDKITRWHPQFDIEKVPDVPLATLPQPPDEEKLTTGTEVLAKARAMFTCNTRMERALEKLKESQGAPQKVELAKALPMSEGSVLKGIPKALLEKVRQRQAAKALEAMTRSTAKEQEAQMYARLPEIARLVRNVFVSEKKGVLPMEVVLNKLSDSYRAFMVMNDMEVHLKTIAKELTGWLVFHEIRGEVFVKLSKNADMSLVLAKLKKLADQKAAL